MFLSLGCTSDATKGHWTDLHPDRSTQCIENSKNVAADPLRQALERRRVPPPWLRVSLVPVPQSYSFVLTVNPLYAAPGSLPRARSAYVIENLFLPAGQFPYALGADEVLFSFNRKPLRSLSRPATVTSTLPR